MNTLFVRMVAGVGVAFAGVAVSTMVAAGAGSAASGPSYAGAGSAASGPNVAALTSVKHDAAVLCAAGTCKNTGPGWDIGFGNVTCPNGLVAPGIALVPPYGVAPLGSASCQQPRLYG